MEGGFLGLTLMRILAPGPVRTGLRTVLDLVWGPPPRAAEYFLFASILLTRDLLFLRRPRDLIADLRRPRDLIADLRRPRDLIADLRRPRDRDLERIWSFL